MIFMKPSSAFVVEPDDIKVAKQIFETFKSVSFAFRFLLIGMNFIMKSNWVLSSIKNVKMFPRNKLKTISLVIV